MKRTIVALALVLSITQDGISQPDSLWSRTFGGGGNDSLWGMISTSDGGVALAGYKSVGGGHSAEGYIVKLDANYAREWDHTYGDSAWDGIYGVAQTADDEYAVAGYTTVTPEERSPGAMFMKLRSNGDPIWTNYAENYDHSEARSVVIRPNGDYAFGGIINPVGRQDDFGVWITSPESQLRREQRYGADYAGEYGLSLINTRDGGMALGGQKIVFGQQGVDSGMVMLVKTDDQGNQQWLHTYTQERSLAFALQVIELTNGGYALFGAIAYSDPEEGITDWNTWLVITNEQGEMTGEHTYDLGHDEFGMGLIAIPGGDFVLVGVTGDQNNQGGMDNANCFLMRVNSVGDVRWQTTYGGDAHDFGLKVMSLEDGGYLIGGTTSSIGEGDTDFWLMATGPDPLSIPADPPSHSSSFSLHHAFPNPFNSSTTITYDVARPGFVRLGVYDAVGRLVGTVKEGYAQPGRHNSVLQAKGLSGGSYFLKLEGERVATQPIVILK